MQHTRPLGRRDLKKEISAMAWMSDYTDMKAVQGRAQQAMGLPLGMASPLWLAFGAATTAGVAWWLMTRWTQALNVEALAVAEAAQPVEIVSLNIAEEAFDATLAPTKAAVAAASAAVEEAIETIEAIAEHEPAAVAEPDDLTLLVGIGPKLAAGLAAHGVTSFAQIAAWTQEDLAKFDAALSLKGRAVRDAWIAQATRHAAA
jgi:predicted flap endonuclease-1-like 5' DNA nuclease